MGFRVENSSKFMSSFFVSIFREKTHTYAVRTEEADHDLISFLCLAFATINFHPELPERGRRHFGKTSGGGILPYP